MRRSRVGGWLVLLGAVGLRPTARIRKWQRQFRSGDHGAGRQISSGGVHGRWGGSLGHPRQLGASPVARSARRAAVRCRSAWPPRSRLLYRGRVIGATGHAGIRGATGFVQPVAVQDALARRAWRVGRGAGTAGGAADARRLAEKAVSPTSCGCSRASRFALSATRFRPNGFCPTMTRDGYACSFKEGLISGQRVERRDAF